MSGSPPSEQGTTPELPADLSQNLDEAADLQLGLGALGGLRHSAACEMAEKSQRRYDERNHRLHELRMRRLGLEGEETCEDEDMHQQVLIRSPIVHNHYQSPAAAQQPQQPATQPDSASPPERPAPPADTQLGEAPHRARILQYLASAVAGAGLVAAGAGIPAMLGDKQEAPAAVDTDTDTQYTIGPARITAKDKADE